MTPEELSKTYQHDKVVLKNWADSHLQPDKAGKGWICPFCGNGSGKGNGEGLVISRNGYLACYGGTCDGEKYSIIDIVAKTNNLGTTGNDFIEACKLTAEQLGVELELKKDEPVIAFNWDGSIKNDKEKPVYEKQKPDQAKQSQKENQNEDIDWEAETVTEVVNGKTIYTHKDHKDVPSVNVYTQNVKKEPDPEIVKKNERIIELALLNFDNAHCIKYLNERGISRETAAATGSIGYKSDMSFLDKKTQKWKKLPAIIFKKDSYRWSARSLQGKYHKKPGKTEDIVWNLQPYIENPNDRPIFVTEGTFDSLSILEAGEQAIALDGKNGNHLLKQLKEHKLKNPFILMLDNDKDGQGQKAQATLYDEMIKAGYDVYTTDLLEQGGHKDGNEYLTAEREKFIAAVKDTAENYRKQDPEYKKYIEEFNEYKAKRFIDGIADSVNNPPIPTGFKRLDKLLDGGLFEGLYVIGGISSLGKTAITLQIADQIAAAGHHVIFYSLEMSENELFSRSISRYTETIGKANGIDPSNYKTVRGITNKLKYDGYNPIERDLIATSINNYFNDTGKTMRIKEAQGTMNADKIRADVEKHIKFTGQKPVIFIDYLQLLTQPENVKRNMTEKQVTDWNIFELKHISRDYKIPVFAISSFNRNNYNNPVAMEAFKESGAIEYSSDVLIGLERQGQDSFKQKGSNNQVLDYLPPVKKYERKYKERFIRFAILKNRNGAADVSVNFNYQFMFNDFIEGEIAPYLDEEFNLDRDELSLLLEK